MLLSPEDPGGEQAVEEGLHEGRAKEVLALLAGELHAERFFQGNSRRSQGRQVALLGAGPCFARVGSQEPGEVLRRGDLRLTQQATLEELGEAFTVLGRTLAR